MVHLSLDLIYKQRFNPQERIISKLVNGIIKSANYQNITSFLVDSNPA